MDDKKEKTDQEQDPKERPIVAFWNKHKKKIAIVSGIIGAVGITNVE